MSVVSCQLSQCSGGGKIGGNTVAVTVVGEVTAGVTGAVAEVQEESVETGEEATMAAW